MLPSCTTRIRIPTLVNSDTSSTLTSSAISSSSSSSNNSNPARLSALNQRCHIMDMDPILYDLKWLSADSLTLQLCSVLLLANTSLLLQAMLPCPQLCHLRPSYHLAMNLSMHQRLRLDLVVGMKRPMLKHRTISAE